MLKLSIVLAAFLAAGEVPASGQSTAPILSINCGGSAFTSSDGTQWSTDQYYAGGDLIYSGSLINGTQDLYLYRTARRGLYGNFSYSIPLANGSYLLRLRFAEIVYSAPGQRVFNVAANSSPLLTNFDILKEVAPLTVDDKQFNVTVSNGTLQVNVTGVVGFGILNGLQVFASTASPPPPTPTLSVSPTSLSFAGTAGGTNPAAQPVSVSNTGAGTLNWTASSNQGWLTVSPTSGSGAATLSASATLSGLAAGSYSGAITVSASGATGSPQTIPVSFSVAPAPVPVLGISSTALSFNGTVGGANPASQSVSVSNTGGGTLNWTASSNQSWLTASPSSGSGPGTLSISANLAGLAAGTYSGAINVSASGATGSPQTIQVSFSVALAPTPALGLSTTALSFAGTAGGANPTAQPVSISNTGGGTLNWTAASNQGWLAVSPPSGSGPATLSISTNLSGLSAGSYSGAITVSASGATGSPQTIQVSLSVAAPAPIQPTGPALASINCGGGSFTGTDGTNWSGDQFFTGGDLAYTGNPINGAADQYLYRSARRGLYGNFSYTVPLANGSYIVVLKFAEIEYGSRGQRVFNVLANGAPALSNFDILAEVPPLTADDKRIPVTVSNGQLQLDFNGVAGRALINGIQVFTAPPPVPALSVSTSSLTFTGTAGGTNPAAQSFTISNTGGTLSWGASNTQSWLHLPSSSGTGGATLSLQPNIAGLSAGTYTDTVTITAPGATPGAATVAITLQLSAPPPSLSVSPTGLTFTATTGGSNPAAQSITISNTGGGTLSWGASNTQSWLHLPASSGTGGASLSLQPNIAGLSAGTYTDTVTISAAGATPSTATVAITLQLSAPPPSLSVSPTSLTFTATAGGASPAAQSFAISNAGGGTLNWSASNTQSWLHLPSSSGTGGATLSIQPSIAGLTAGTYTDTVTITAPGAIPGTATVAITLQLSSPSPSLSTSPAGLTFSATIGGSNPAAQSFTISNAGGGTLNWSASNTQPWLQLPSSSGTGGATLSLQPNIAGLSAGTYTDTITVSAPGANPGTATVSITLQLTVPPSLSASPTSLTFSATAGGANPAAQSAAIANTGGGTLNWSASNTQSWLHLPSSSGTGAATLSLQPSITGLSAGTYTDTITVTAPGANPGTATVAITLQLAAPPSLSATPAGLSFSAFVGGSNPAAQSLAIANAGGGTLNWSASNTQPWLHLPSSSGTGAATLSLQPNIAGLSAGTYTDTVTLTASGANPGTATVAITLQLTAPPASLSVSPASLTFSATARQTGPAAQSLIIANTGSGTMTWSASNTQSWLRLPSSSGTGAATLSIQPSLAGLSAGTYSDTITVSAPAANPSSASIPVTFTVAAPSFTTSGTPLVSINCGGGAYTGVDGTNWAGDQYFTGGDIYYSGSPISGTQDFYLYRTARRGLYGDFTYSIPIANGSYAVSLRFAELQVANRGQRVFNVLLNGSPALTNFDILAEVPQYTVDEKQLPVTVSNGTLRIDLVGVTGYGMLNAIQVFAATPVAPPTTSTPPPPPPPTLPSGPGNSANTDQWTANPNPSQTFDPNGGAVLYNGIQLAAAWPPLGSPTQQYFVPPYLVNRPAVIPIDVGRQLFVDDFLIDQTTLTRMQHQPAAYSGNPVVTPNTQGMDFQQNLALVYSDGVWYDPADQTFKMWYDGGYGNNLCYAVSSDGINWTKPRIPDATIPFTNIVLQLGGGRDSTTVWMDLHDDPSRKFKLFAYYPDTAGYHIGIYFSPDGIHWGAMQPNSPNSLSDRTTVFYNPFRGVWVESARNSTDLPLSSALPAATVRSRFYSESRNLQNWTPSNPQNSFWLSRDDRDPPYPGSTTAPEMYNLDGTPYESLMVGLFSWYYPPDGPDLVELGIGFTRDGFHWSRPTRGGGPANALIAASDQVNTWNGYNTQSAGGGFLVIGDLLYIYFSGRDTPHELENSKTIRSTGLAVLRRDGFYSMAAGSTQGTLTTHALRFSGSHLFVNVVDPTGQLQAEVLDANGNVIPGFAKSNSAVVSADTTRREITWGGASLGSLAGQTVKLRFYLTNGELYSFWVTNSASGASNGYIAAGGPGFTSDMDK
jgi:hypothetical protein